MLLFLGLILNFRTFASSVDVTAERAPGQRGLCSKKDMLSMQKLAFVINVDELGAAFTCVYLSNDYVLVEVFNFETQEGCSAKIETS